MYKQSTVTGFIKFINRLGRKKPKWETDSDWMKDEAAVNDWYDALFGDFPNTPGYLRESAREKRTKMTMHRLNKLINKYNLGYRRQRVDDKTAYFIDKLLDLGLIDKEYRNKLLKGDRWQSLSDADFEYTNAVEENPNYEQIFEGWDWDKADDEAYIAKLKRTPYGDELVKLYNDIYNYRPHKDAPTTRKDTGSIEDATPYQLERWNREANKSVLLEGLKGSLKTGLRWGGLGALAGIPFGLSAASSGNGDSSALGGGLAGALLLGTAGGLVGSAYGGLADALTAYKKKRHAKYRLNEKPIK